jgi:hypothetical protein
MEALESANLALRVPAGATGRPHLAWGFAGLVVVNEMLLYAWTSSG